MAAVHLEAVLATLSPQGKCLPVAWLDRGVRPQRIVLPPDLHQDLTSLPNSPTP